MAMPTFQIYEKSLSLPGVKLADISIGSLANPLAGKHFEKAAEDHFPR
ncbi:hypothetical protein [uncultured Neglectibacter sp.]